MGRSRKRGGAASAKQRKERRQARYAGSAREIDDRAAAKKAAKRKRRAEAKAKLRPDKYASRQPAGPRRKKAKHTGGGRGLMSIRGSRNRRDASSPHSK